jgi:hypothetical protein
MKFEKLYLIALKRSYYGFFGDCVRQIQKPLETWIYYRNYANSGGAKGNRKMECHFYLPHMEYEGSIGLVSRKMKIFFR